MAQRSSGTRDDDFCHIEASEVWIPTSFLLLLPRPFEQAVMEVLIQKGALDGDSLRILPLGLVSRSLQGQNELWLALALTHPVVLGLTGSQLAAFLGALLR